MNELNLYTELQQAKQAWENALFQLHRAKAEYDYAERRVILARDQLLHKAYRSGDPQAYFDPDTLAELTPIEYLGKSVGEAAQGALLGLGRASPEQIMSLMRQRGFQFTADVPVREIHGALVRQPWARRDEETGEWEYVYE